VLKDEILPQTIRDNGIHIKKVGYLDSDSIQYDRASHCEREINLPRQMNADPQKDHFVAECDERKSNALEEIDSLMQLHPDKKN